MFKKPVPKTIWNNLNLVDPKVKEQLKKGIPYYDPDTKKTYNNYSDYYFRFDARHKYNKMRPDF